MSDYPRKTFAIISHPDAGKTTLTEKFLLYGGAIQLAGSIKAKKAGRHATSDWMEMEKQRGISVTTSVMQFVYADVMVNLLDTPGHADFTEDTYRTLTAVDSALMVIDAAKGVEARTIKLMEVCRMRTTPIMTFINKMDRETRDPIEVLDEIESVLDIQCAPITWPIGSGKRFKGVYHLLKDEVHAFDSRAGENAITAEVIKGLESDEAKQALGDMYDSFKEELELVQGACHAWNEADYLSGKLTPVFFGSAINNFGVNILLDDFVQVAPEPQPRETETREVKADENKLTGFVFKVQANMDPNHRDRIAFFRIVSGQYQKGMKLNHVRINKTVNVPNAVTFMAGARESAETAEAGDIIGLHNHGTIQIGDTFTQGEKLKFTGIPHFAPELFQLVRLQDPLKQKALLKGLLQLSEEGATQVFRPIQNNNLILGAVGSLQFDVVAHRLKEEYGVSCIYEPVNVATVRWIDCDDNAKFESFKQEQGRNLALDNGDHLCYLAPSAVNLQITQENWPDVVFRATREH